MVRREMERESESGKHTSIKCIINNSLKMKIGPFILLPEKGKHTFTKYIYIVYIWS